jgi:hypothetical protein
MLHLMLGAPVVCSCRNKHLHLTLSPIDYVFGIVNDDAGASLHQITQEFMLVEVTSEEDKQIINCLEHVSFGGCYFEDSLLLLWFLILFIRAGSHLVKELNG